jgi:hypothetical protein
MIDFFPQITPAPAVKCARASLIETYITQVDVNVRFESALTSETVVIVPACDIKNLRFTIYFEKTNGQAVYSKTENITSAIKGTEYRFKYDLLVVLFEGGSFDKCAVRNMSGTKMIWA